MTVQPIKDLNVVPNCKVTQTVWNFQTESMKLKTVAEVMYTPKAINEALKELNITEAVYVIGPAGKELWKVGEKFARQL